jgi:hypothetical protein
MALLMAIWGPGKPDRLLHHFRPAKPVHQQAVPAVDVRPRRRLVDSRSGSPEQCGDGDFLLLAEDRTNSPQDTATAMTLERFYSQNAGTRRLAISVLWSLRGRRD